MRRRLMFASAIATLTVAAPSALADREINDDLLRKTAHQIADRRVSDEGREGLAAFLEKRKPYWAD